MKNLLSKLLPLIEKFKGKKPIVIILSIVAIAAGIFAVEKGYITEDALKIDVIVDLISSSFETPVVDSVVSPVDSVKAIVVDSIPAE
jgi:hypothetical protein